MNLLEILKNYWYVLVIAIVLIGVVVYYINYMAKTNPNKNTKKDTNSKSAVNENETTNKQSGVIEKNVVAKQEPITTNKIENGSSHNTKTQNKSVTKNTNVTSATKTTVKKESDLKPKNVVKNESVTKPATSVKKVSSSKESPVKKQTVAKAKPSVSTHEKAKVTASEDTTKNVNYRVVHEKETGTWVIKKSDTTRVIRRVKTKEEAMEVVKSLSKNQGLNVVVHKRNGKFQSKQ